MDHPGVEIHAGAGMGLSGMAMNLEDSSDLDDLDEE